MTKETENPIQKTKRKSMPWRGIAIAFSTFSVIVLLYIFYAANFFFIKKITFLTHTQNMLFQVQKNQGAIEQQVRQLADDSTAQAQVMNALRQTQTGLNRDEWRVLEAEFLVRLASDKLQFENNAQQAVALLQVADQKIRDMNDARLLPLRKALADDITSLQAVPSVDTAGLYLRLSAINEQINQLPLPNKVTQSPQAQIVSGSSGSWWKQGLHQTWEALQKIVVVRYNEKNKPPLIGPEQQDFLYLNLHATLEKAMWGLLHQQPGVYKASLQQAVSWIKQYFVGSAPLTESVIKTLTELQEVNIHPVVPQTIDSLAAFQTYFSARDVQVAPTPAATN
jgi:uroporphyrin-3 C-methyltransferase